MVGMAARMRESSLTLPSSSGTLKSTRTKTRLPDDVDVADGELVHGRPVGVGAGGAGRPTPAGAAATKPMRSATRQL